MFDVDTAKATKALLHERTATEMYVLLIRLTKNDRVRWQESVSRGTFIASTAAYSMTVRERTFSISNEFGVSVDHIDVMGQCDLHALHEDLLTAIAQQVFGLEPRLRLLTELRQFIREVYDESRTTEEL